MFRRPQPWFCSQRTEAELLSGLFAAAWTWLHREVAKFAPNCRFHLRFQFPLGGPSVPFVFFGVRPSKRLRMQNVWHDKARQISLSRAGRCALFWQEQETPPE